MGYKPPSSALGSKQQPPIDLSSLQVIAIVFLVWVEPEREGRSQGISAARGAKGEIESMT
jgi:hypothetical protein